MSTSTQSFLSYGFSLKTKIKTWKMSKKLSSSGNELLKFLQIFIVKTVQCAEKLEIAKWDCLMGIVRTAGQCNFKHTKWLCKLCSCLHMQHCTVRAFLVCVFPSCYFVVVVCLWIQQSKWHQQQQCPCVLAKSGFKITVFSGHICMMMMLHWKQISNRNQKQHCCQHTTNNWW